MKNNKISLLLLTLTIISIVLCLVRIKKSFPTITLITSTSVEDSGLLDILIPAFEKKYNYRVKAIACGSGQAIRLAREGNADVIFVHDPEAEEKLVNEGGGKKRYTVMYNNFVIVGPKSNKVSTDIHRCKTVFDVFKKIATSKAYFISRADNSGTHKKELSIWKKINSQEIQKYLDSKYYLQSGTGMAQTLYISNEKNAYCLTDKATYIRHKKNLNSVEIVFSDDSFLFNLYSVIPVISTVEVNNFIEFICSSEVKEIIKNYGIEQFNQQLFYPL
ncbi:MAG: substrate-binding domain-containing protein [Elusimicrobiota bacterium]|nr:substrate-binding domain-containing protein [Elusimicrobiota bacterium]